MLMNATTHAVIIIFFMDEYFKVKTTNRCKNIVPSFNRSIFKVLSCGLPNRFYSGEFFDVRDVFSAFSPLTLSLSPLVITSTTL
jgi:hypothetical protein